MHDEFAEMARQELGLILSTLPTDPIYKSLVFVETLRTLDYWSVFQQFLPKEHRLKEPDLNIIQWGFNLATEHLFSPVNIPGAFPIMESTDESKSFALTLLYRFGCSVLMSRASEMIRYGYLDVHRNKNKFIVKKTGCVNDQFLDKIDFFELAALEEKINNNDSDFFNNWRLIETDEYSKYQKQPGFFFGRSSRDYAKDFEVENIDELMTSLVHPWDSGRGIMMGYGALPEVDDYFVADAVNLVVEWRNEAGLHSEVKLDKISAGDLGAVILILTALYRKHVRFALLAIKKYPEISIHQSLSIWGPVEELAESIAFYTHLDKDLVKILLDTVTLFPNEVSNLSGFTTPFVPLLISLGNGIVLRPISSVNQNPFFPAITLQEWRNPEIIHEISQKREDLMREMIYALFLGDRYLRVDGNIKIRNERKIVTDIDGAIFDILTGELAFFQIKWQDYFTNNVRKLRSKTSNLAKEFDEWAEKIDSWIKHKGNDQIIQSLRLKVPKGMSISSIYLFGISRSTARVSGYGYTIKNENLAVSNWAQFSRIRFEAGPADRVFQMLFNALKTEMKKSVNVKPIPVTIEVSGNSITFEDLWNGFGEDAGDL